jgi:hypothetical protein
MMTADADTLEKASTEADNGCWDNPLTHPEWTMTAGGLLAVVAALLAASLLVGVLT